MCFSATASFTAGAALLGIGVLALARAPRAVERPYAAIPLLFGLQQVVEGLVWLSFGWGSAIATDWLAQLYSFFSHVLWPVYVPVAAWLIERDQGRRRAIGATAVAAFVLGSYLLWTLFTDPVKAVPVGGHIEYNARHLYAPVVMLFYLAATTGSLMMSGHAWVRRLGVLALVASVEAYLAFARWFISVWCFFAAILSVLVLLHLGAGQRARDGRGLAATPVAAEE